MGNFDPGARAFQHSPIAFPAGFPAGPVRLEAPGTSPSVWHTPELNPRR